MTVLHDIDSAAYAVRHGFAGDIIPVATNFNVVRIPRPEGGDEYRVYSYRTLVAFVMRACVARLSVRRMRRSLRRWPMRWPCGRRLLERLRS